MKILVLLLMSVIAADGFSLDEKFQLKVEKVQGLDGTAVDFEWEFFTEHGTRLILVCPEKWAYNDKPHIKYFNYQHYYVRDFHFNKKGSCEQLNIYLRGVAFQIDPNNPLIIEFNRRTGKIDDFVVPDLDPYIYKDPKIQEYKSQFTRL